MKKYVHITTNKDRLVVCQGVAHVGVFSEWAIVQVCTVLAFVAAIAAGWRRKYATLNEHRGNYCIIVETISSSMQAIIVIWLYSTKQSLRR